MEVIMSKFMLVITTKYYELIQHDPHNGFQHNNKTCAIDNKRLPPNNLESFNSVFINLKAEIPAWLGLVTAE